MTKSEILDEIEEDLFNIICATAYEEMDMDQVRDKLVVLVNKINNYKILPRKESE